MIGDFLASADIKPFDRTYVGRAASYWPAFFTPKVFLFSISLLFVNISLLVEVYKQMLLSFEKFKQQFFKTFSTE